MTILKNNLKTLNLSRAIVTKESLSDLAPYARAGNFLLKNLRALPIVFFEFVEFYPL